MKSFFKIAFIFYFTDKFCKLIYRHIFNNFKISPDFDWSIATDGSHPFSGKAQQDYCDKEKRLELLVA